MTQWGLDALFNPGKKHMDEEKRRLQATRAEVGDSSGGKRIDLESGKVTIRRKTDGASGTDDDADADDEVSADDAASADDADADDADADDVDADDAASAEAEDAAVDAAEEPDESTS